jgi:hypothetical protein
VAETQIETIQIVSSVDHSDVIEIVGLTGNGKLRFVFVGDNRRTVDEWMAYANDLPDGQILLAPGDKIISASELFADYVETTMLRPTMIGKAIAAGPSIKNYRETAWRVMIGEHWFDNGVEFILNTKLSTYSEEPPVREVFQDQSEFARRFGELISSKA